MIGAGAIAGTLAGGHTNAARSPQVDPIEQAVSPAASADNDAVAARPYAPSAQKQIAAEAAPPAEDSAAPLIFAARWENVPAVRNRTPSTPSASSVMAYAAESQRKAAAPAAAAAGGYQLASADPNPPMPKRMERPAQPKPAVLFNDAQLASIKARLRLTPEQQQYWPQVEQALRAISWRIATQQQNGKRPVRGNQASMIDPNSPEVQRLKSAAFPLIMSMREDQKQQVRQLAHTMGLSQVASAF